MSIISGVRSILVDEFQDMNENRYRLLRALNRASNTAVMVIGDDDQDIIRWEAADTQVEGREYFERFQRDFDPVDKFNFRVNFRSSPEIVECSQAFINDRLARDRMKADIGLRSSRNAVPGEAIADFLINPQRIAQEIAECVNNGRTCAVLCRSNDEAHRWHHELPREVQIQGDSNLCIARFRHVGVFLDFCRRTCKKEGDQPITPRLYERLCERLKMARAESQIPEVEYESNIHVQFLWDALLGENPRASLEDFITFVEELRLHEYTRMLRKTELDKWKQWCHEHRIGMSLVSTIHKVKGLEFDTVVVVPPISQANADDVRLFYVAMTRAKTRLLYSRRPVPRPNVNRGDAIFLKGSPEEVYFTWPAHDDCLQSYIRSAVGYGDELTLDNCNGYVYLVHGETRIGRLARDPAVQAQGRDEYRVVVDSVYRYPVTDEALQRYRITPDCINRGWYYTVFVRGVIQLKGRFIVDIN